jgi:hypothetical protein
LALGLCGLGSTGSGLTDLDDGLRTLIGLLGVPAGGTQINDILKIGLVVIFIFKE